MITRGHSNGGERPHRSAALGPTAHSSAFSDEERTALSSFVVCWMSECVSVCVVEWLSMRGVRRVYQRCRVHCSRDSAAASGWLRVLTAWFVSMQGPCGHRRRRTDDMSC